MQLSELVASAAILVVAGAAGQRYLKGQRPVDRDVFLAFAPFAILGVLELIPQGEALATQPWMLPLIYVQPVLFALLVRHVGNNPRWPALIAAAGGLASIAIVLRDPSAMRDEGNPGWPMLAATVAAFLVPNVWVGVRFAQAAVRSAGVAKVRLVWAAVASFLFLGALFTYSVPAGSPLQMLSDLTSIGLATAFLLGFAPPRWMLRAWRSAAYVEFAQAAAKLPADLPTDEFDRRLLATARGVLDADAIRFAPAPGTLPGDVSAATGATGHRAYLVATFAGRRLFPEDDRLTLQALAAACWSRIEPRERLKREEAARKAAEDQAAFKASFLRHFGHEVANPLSPVRLKAGILERLATPEQLPHLEVIRRNIKRIEEIIEDVSNVAKAIDPRAPRHLSELDVGDLLRDAAVTYDDAAAKGNCQLKVEAAPGLVITADRPRLAQVFDNLYSNAIKYSPQGGPVTVSATPDGGGVRVAFKDSGLGFDDKQGAQLFRTYSRVHKEVAPGIPGSGLGLYLVQEVAHTHGGWAKAESAGPGQGSTFTVWLPDKPPVTPGQAAFRA